MNSSNLSKDNEITKKEIALLLASLIFIICFSVLTVIMSFDFKTSVLKLRTDNNVMAGVAGGFLLTLSTVSVSILWILPLAIAVELRKSRLKNLWIYGTAALIYSACGFISCIIVGLFLPRWI